MKFIKRDQEWCDVLRDQSSVYKHQALMETLASDQRPSGERIEPNPVLVYDWTSELYDWKCEEQTPEKNHPTARAIPIARPIGGIAIEEGVSVANYLQEPPCLDAS